MGPTTLSLTVLVLAAGGIAEADVNPPVCVDMHELVGVDAADGAALSARLGEVLVREGFRMELRAPGETAATCTREVLAVIEVTLVRVGATLSVELRARQPSSQTPQQTHQVQVARTELARSPQLAATVQSILAELHPEDEARRAASAPASQRTRGVDGLATTAPGESSRPFGWPTLALWGAGGAALVVAGILEADAYSHYQNVQQGAARSQVDNREGMASQRNAGIAALSGLVLGAAGLLIEYLGTD